MQLLVTLLLCVITASDRVEHRRYSVTVDGRVVGFYTQDIRHDPDTKEYEVCAVTSVHVKVLMVKVDHEFRGKEIWMHGFLRTLESSTIENGSRRSANADIDNRLDWTSSYWTLPRKECLTKPFHLLDLENGQDRLVTLKPAGKDQHGDHYQVLGDGFRVELWYDAAKRLVRREMARQGRWTIVQYLGGKNP